MLADIADWHVRGTRYQIHVDPADGLLYAGEPGVQLTWMDAKVEDWVVTPRIGHEGTVWGWLIRPFVSAHLQVYRDPALAR